jgi:hypothetical protein
LQDDNSVVIVDDQRGYQIAFGIDQTTSMVRCSRSVVRCRAAADFLAPEFLIDRFVAGREDAQRDFRRIAVEGFADEVFPSS